MTEHSFALIVDDQSDTTTLADTLVALASRLAQALDCFECCIYEHLPDERSLRCQAIWSRELTERDKEWVGQLQHLDALPGLADAVAERTIFVEYPEVDRETSGAERMDYWGELAALYAPIVGNDEVLGVLELTEKRSRREFSESDKRLVEQMAALAAVALKTARESQDHIIANHRLAALVEASSAFSSTTDVDEVLALVCQLAGRSLDAAGSYIYEYDPAMEALIWCGQYQRDDVDAAEEPMGTVYPLTDYPFDRRALESDTPRQASIDDPGLDEESRANLVEFDETALLTVPLRYGSEIVGLLEIVEIDTPRHFTDEEIALAAALGEQAAAAIRNAELIRRMGQQNEQMRALLDSSRAISSTVVLEEVLERVGEQAARAVKAASCYIYEYDALNDSIVWRSHHQADASCGATDPLGTAYPLEAFPWDRAVLRSGQPSHVTVQDPGVDGELLASMREWHEQSLLTVPLLFGQQPVGLMELAETTHPRRFSAEEIDLAKAIGEQAAIAIRNAQLYRRETWRNERLVRVLEISRAVGSSLDATQVIEGLQAQVGRLFADNPAAVAVHLLSRPAESEEKSLPAGVDALIATALQRLAPLQAPLEREHRLIVPLVQKGDPVGYLEIVGGGQGGFETDEVELVQLLANQAAASVDNARLYETIERQAITDGLTGLYNHRHFFQCLRSEVTRARRYGFSLSVLMLDLDDFKSFNDRFGHPAGDRVLRAVADILRGQLRQEIDVPARYGGEEFAVILPHTPWPGAQTVGERITSSLGALDEAQPTSGALITGERVRKSIAEAPLPLLDAGHPAHVTVSVGVATLPAHAVDADELVSKADQALYRAKQEGKNRVDVYLPS